MWSYRNPGSSHSEESIPDEEFLRLAANGDLKESSFIFHPSKTQGEWVRASQNPRILRVIETGGQCLEDEEFEADTTDQEATLRNQSAELVRSGSQAVGFLCVVSWVVSLGLVWLSAMSQAEFSGTAVALAYTLASTIGHLSVAMLMFSLAEFLRIAVRFDKRS